jgi:hypothetical protein
MVIVFDTRTTPNITEILWDGTPVTVFNWSVTDDSTSAFDYEGFRIIVGATGVQVKFDSAEALEPYHNQYHMYISGAFNPVIDGYKVDPAYDHAPDPTGKIIPHTYENTDIEKDLIDGGN